MKSTPRKQKADTVNILKVPRLGPLVLIFLTLLLIPLAAKAQDADTQRERILDEPFRLMLDETVPMEKRSVLDWGGWYRSSFWDVDDNVDTDLDGSDDGRHVLRRQQLRLWGQYNIDQVHQFYARGRLDYLDWNHGTSFNHNDSDWEGFDLDRAWYDFQLSRAQQAYGEKPGDFDFATRIGRQFVRLGSGLALSMPLDAVWLDSYWQDWQLSGLMALSVPSTHNIDQSVPDNSRESRRFWGAQLAYKGWRDHEPFVYFFSQNDQDFGSRRLGQTFGYDSMYSAAGSRGMFFHRDVQYNSEFVVENGKSYAFGPVENQQNIEAWAFDSELRYLVPDPHRSQLLVEYLLASGDSDRRFSPTDTVGGNQLHTTDTSFSGFGFRNTGLSLAPRISNLGMVRLGASTFPVNDCNLFKEFVVGADFFIYHKQQSQAAISDSQGFQHHSFLGTGVDLYANWRIVSDVAWTVRYGVFMPGDAFRNQTDRHQIFTGLTMNF